MSPRTLVSPILIILTAGTLLTEGSAAASSFYAAELYHAGFDQRALSRADFDGDGSDDLVVVHASSPNARILLGGGSGPLFTLDPTVYTLLGTPVDVVAGDFDGDADQDFAVLHSAASNGVLIFLGDGAGGFPNTLQLTHGSNQGAALVAAELNGDSQTDLAAANSNGNLSFFPSDGAGGFLAAVTLTAGNDPSDVIAPDLEGDGDHDLLVVNRQDGDFRVHRNDGAGAFTPDPSDYPTSRNQPNVAAAADFNLDGTTDVVVAHLEVSLAGANTNSGYSALEHFHGAAGGFASVDVFKTGQCPADLVAADLDHDGRADLALVTQGGNANCSWTTSMGYTYLYNKVTDRFDVGSTFATSNAPRQVTTADFDGDGDRDIAVAHGFHNLYVDLASHRNPSGIQLRFEELVDSLGGASGAILQGFVYNGPGGGAVVGDFNDDGWADLYLIDGSAGGANRILIHNGQPAQFAAGGDPFTERIGHLAGAANTSSTGAVVADFNNDGWHDIYVVGSVGFSQLGDCETTTACRETNSTTDLMRMENRLYINDGDQDGVAGWDGTFRDETSNAGVIDLVATLQGNGFYKIDRGNTRAVVAADFNRDGWVDLYTGNFFDNGGSSLGNPSNQDFGMPNGLYISNGVDATGTLQAFTEMAAPANVLGTLNSGAADLSDGGSALGLFAGDIDNDGWIDLYVANDMDLPDGAPLYLNDGDQDGLPGWDGTFTEVAEAFGLHPYTRNGMGCDFGDYDLDGWFDFAASDTMNTQGLNAGNALIHTGSASVVDFPNPAGAGFGWHVGFEDFDLDGDEELHVTTTWHAPDQLYRNDGSTAGRPVLTNVGGRTLGHFEDSRGAAYADFDHDGWTDVFLLNPNAKPRLYMNRSGVSAPLAHHWLQVRALAKVSALGQTVWRDAVGARVTVWAPSVTVAVHPQGVLQPGPSADIAVEVVPALHAMREIQSGEGASGSTSELFARFGLGRRNQPVQVMIRWPDGTSTTFNNVAIDQRVTLQQP